MKVSFKTFGCKLNQAETREIKQELLKKGVKIVPLEKKPDIYVINACSVTARAERKLRQEIYNINRQYPNIYLIVAGCFTKNLKNNKKINSLVEAWFSNKKKSDLTKEILKVYNFKKQKTKIITPYSQNKNRAMVKIQNGCNQFCSYCIVPFLRKELKSKSLDQTVQEINNLKSRGFKEINLVGANLSLYKFKNNSLLDLLKYIIKNTDIPRIRISSLWPTFLNDKFIDFISNQKRICPYIHLSVQSGCDKILKKMNRNYSVNQVKGVIKKLKSKSISIGTDIIVGFPNETKKDFQKTYQFVKWAKFINLHVFKYSKRPGTKAASFKKQVNPKVKNKRSKKLRLLGKKIFKKELKNYLKNKKSAQVLFEQKKGKYWLGKTPNYINVYFKSNLNLFNKIKKVNLIKPFKKGVLVK